MRETHLVGLLVESGMDHGRAVRFEHHLDDRRPNGVSGAVLAHYIRKLVSQRLPGEEAELARLRKRVYLLEIFAGVAAIHERAAAEKTPKKG